MIIPVPVVGKLIIQLLKIMKNFEELPEDKAETKPENQTPYNWKTIDCAPTDGSLYLGVIVKNGIIGEAFTALYDEDEGGHVCQFRTEGFWHKPTHWIPLPKFTFDKPETQSPELSPEVKEAMKNLKYHAGIANYFDKETALDDIKDAAKNLLNALEKHFANNKTQAEEVADNKIEWFENEPFSPEFIQEYKEKLGRCPVTGDKIEPNEETLKSFSDYEKGVGLTENDSVEELFEDLKEESHLLNLMYEKIHNQNFSAELVFYLGQLILDSINLKERVKKLETLINKPF